MEIEERIVQHNELVKKINALNEQLHALEKPIMEHFGELHGKELQQRYRELLDSTVTFEVFRRYLYKGPKRI